MIPKIIHYCWFGGNPLPELAQKCIASWKKFLPGYEIKEWNESNYDVRKITYTAQAYDAKKYAFVSDYARFDILYQYGGVYFDTDVEVIKPMDDILANGAFLGLEKTDSIQIASGLGIACEKEDEMYARILDSYRKSSFLNSDGSHNLLTVVKRVTDIFEPFGFVKENRVQKIKGIMLYPTEYFCPKDLMSGELNITENTHTIHHYDGSWMPLIQKKTFEYGQNIYQKYGKNFLSQNLVRIRIFFFRFHEDGIKKTVQFYMSKFRGKTNE